MKKIILGILTIALFILAGSSVLGAAGAARPSSVYTISNAASNSVLQFYSNNGMLTFAKAYPTGGSGTGARLASQGAVALTQDGQWLLAVDAGSNDIAVFHVKGDGSLTETASLTPSDGTHPISITVHGDLVYVLNNGTKTVAGNIAGFWLSNTGVLTFITTSPLSPTPNSSPEQIGFSNDGNVLVVTEKAAGIIDTYTVTGGVASAPLATPSNSAGPYGFAFTSQGYLVLSEAATGTLSSYAVSDSGALRTLSGSIPDFGLAPCWVAVSPNGQFVYTTNAHGGTISGYSVSGTGTLSLFSSVAANAHVLSIPSLDMAFGNNGQFLYVLNGNYITSFQVYPDGSIVQVSSASGALGSAAGLAAT